MTSTFNVRVRLTGAQVDLLLTLLDDATDDRDNPVTVEGARRKLAAAYDEARRVNRANRLDAPATTAENPDD